MERAFRGKDKGEGPMVGEILNKGGERLQNPSTPRAVNSSDLFEGN